jgi:hypothetical protein
MFHGCVDGMNDRYGKEDRPEEVGAGCITGGRRCNEDEYVEKNFS